MNDVIAFVRDYIAKDEAARRAAYGEPDESVFEEKVRTAESFFDPESGHMGSGSAWDYPVATDSPERASAKRQTLARIRPSILFLVRRYAHSTLGDLYRAYLDDGTTGRRTGYFECVFVANTSRGLRIIARWGICLTCQGTGELDGEECHQCRGRGWEEAGGQKLGDLGPVVETHRFEAPTEEASLADYRQD